MKKYFKEMWVSYALALMIPYMLFIVEPISMYANNINDFWFDLSSMLSPLSISFIITFLVLSIINNIAYFINKTALKVINVITFIGFICTYIQGNYLVGNLPVLDGTVIDWTKYSVDNIISIVLWLIVIIASVILIKKFKIDNYVKYSGYVTLAVFVMISSSFLTTFLTTDVLKVKDVDVISTATIKNINKYSKDDNFIIFMLDAVDSKYFDKALKNNKDMAKILNDFTYYPDTMSMYPFTQESVPQILSGHVYENESQYVDYVVKSMKDSTLLNELYSKNYEVNVYETELFFYDKDALKIDNIINSAGGNNNLNKKEYIKEQIRYDLFRYLPFFLKKYSKIEYLNFVDTRSINENMPMFSDDTISFLDYFENKEIENSEKKNFKFIHLTGAHVPNNFNKNLEMSASFTYYDEVEGCLTIINRYLNYLKEKNVYDNSKIIIMADHGYAMRSNGSGTFEGRQNPMFLVKGKNEKHDKMIESDKAISYNDLSDAYKDLLNNKKSTELFNNITNERTRRYLFYKYSEENHMEEYETKGKAWETNKMYKTGKEFNR